MKTPQQIVVPVSAKMAAQFKRVARATHIPVEQLAEFLLSAIENIADQPGEMMDIVEDFEFSDPKEKASVMARLKRQREAHMLPLEQREAIIAAMRALAQQRQQLATA